MEKIDLKWSQITLLTNESLDLLDQGMSGVYRMSYRHDEKSIYVFYVGSSDDLKEKLKSHLSVNENSACIKKHLINECYFKYTNVDDKIKRELVYKQLCKFYQPPCNERSSLSEDIVVINVN